MAHRGKRASKNLAERDRRDRHATTDILIGRMLRGVLSAAEAALLAEHVREEQRTGDATRQSLAETTAALTRHREAADAAIVEAEQRAEQAEEQLKTYRAAADIAHVSGISHTDAAQALTAVMAPAEQAQADAERYKADYLSACGTIAEMHAAATGRTGMGPDRGVVEDVADVRERAEQADRHRRALAAILAKPADTPFAELTEYAAHCLTRSGARIIAAQEHAEQAVEAHRREVERADEHTVAAMRRADTYRNAWHSARDRARKYATRAQRAAATYETQTAALRRQLARAEADADKYSKHARKAELHKAAMSRWADNAVKADQRATAAEQRARAAEKQAAAADAERNRYAKHARKAAQRLDAMRRSAAQDGPEVITDRATIRAALDEPEPRTLAEALDRMRQRAAAGMPAAQLTKPCANPAHVGYATTGECVHGPAAN
ncbi:hypothetical protein ACFZB5_33520 [Streptomyces nodosus]|uniref:hypothetical protein n=1 Tax=Streptomyces nodosus TaxID=40318 RepID=UPI0036F16598